jgi:hypothetical protein
MVTRTEAILWAILERCARSPQGYPADPSNAVVAQLLEQGLVLLNEDGQALATDKGREVLKLLPSAYRPDPSRRPTEPGAKKRRYRRNPQ